MAVSRLFNMAEGQLEVFEEALEAVRKEGAVAADARGKAVLAAKLRNLLHNATLIPEVLRRQWDSTLELIAVGHIDDLPSTKSQMVQAFAKARQVLSELENQADSFEHGGNRIQGREKLTKARLDLTHLEGQVFTHWPDFSTKDLTEALAEYKKGNCLEISDMFAQLVGVDVDTWLRMVEDRKKSNP